MYPSTRRRRIRVRVGELSCAVNAVFGLAVHSLLTQLHAP
jgi:hypothetical protein